MKKFVSIILVLGLVLINVNAIKIDNKNIDSDLRNGTLMVPIHTLSAALEIEIVSEGGGYRLYQGARSGRTMLLKPESKIAVCSIKDFDEVQAGFYEAKLNVEPFWQDADLYVPLRVVAEYFNARVYWEEGKGARVELGQYRSPALIRVKGNVRERVDISDSVGDDLVVYDGRIYYTADKLYSLNLQGSDKKAVGPAGKFRFNNQRLFIQAGDKIISSKPDGSDFYTIIDGFTSYVLLENRILCFGKKTIIIDYTGKVLNEIKGDFYTIIDVIDNRVYYLDKEKKLYSADCDGKNEKLLVSDCINLTLIENWFYYLDFGQILHRVSLDGEKNEIVYGLNFEFAGTFGDKILFNFYGNKFKKIFMINPDGTGIQELQKADFAAKSTIEAEGNLFIIPSSKAGVYKLLAGEVSKISDDTPATFCGSNDGFIYYLVN